MDGFFGWQDCVLMYIVYMCEKRGGGANIFLLHMMMSSAALGMKMILS